METVTIVLIVLSAVLFLGWVYVFYLVWSKKERNDQPWVSYMRGLISGGKPKKKSGPMKMAEPIIGDNKSSNDEEEEEDGNPEATRADAEEESSYEEQDE